MRAFYLLGLLLGSILGAVLTIYTSTDSDGLRLVMLLLGAVGIGFVTSIYDAMDDDE